MQKVALIFKKTNVIKIAIDLTPFENKKAPGYNNYIIALLESILTNKGQLHNFHLFLREDQYEFFNKYSSDFEIHTFKIKNTFQRILFQNVYYPLIRWRYDLFLYTANTAPLFFSGSYVLVIHDLNFLKFPHNFKITQLLYRKLFIKKSIVNARSVIAISNCVKEEVYSFCNVLSEVIHNPILNISSEESPEQVDNSVFFKSSNINTTIVVPSSLSAHKNIQACLSAIEYLTEKNSSLGVYFIGNWSIDQFPVIKNNNQIKVLGYVNEATRNAIFRSVNFILFPSIYEGFGLPYLESLLFEKPIICSDINIAREILNTSANYIEFPFADINIINAIERVLNKNNTYDILKLNILEYNNKIAQKYIQTLTQ